MAYFIYRPARSTSARELADALPNGFRARTFSAGTFFSGRDGRGRPRTPVAGDTVICWGSVVPAFPQGSGITVLNNVAIASKFADAQKLQAAGVPTIQVSQTRPAPQPRQAAQNPAELQTSFAKVQELADDFLEIEQIQRSTPFLQGIDEFYNAIVHFRNLLRAPVPAPVADAVWVGRSNDHVGGNDLLTPPAAPAFYVRKEDITEEVRIHSFMGKSIRAGKKAPREGVQQHPWVRSFDGGWRIVYDGFESNEVQRLLAKQAVAALGLQFGAVDLGLKRDGTWIVLEVNRAPGLEGGSVTAYANTIQNPPQPRAEGRRAA